MNSILALRYLISFLTNHIGSSCTTDFFTSSTNIGTIIETYAFKNKYMQYKKISKCTKTKLINNIFSNNLNHFKQAYDISLVTNNKSNITKRKPCYVDSIKPIYKCIHFKIKSHFVPILFDVYVYLVSSNFFEEINHFKVPLIHNKLKNMHAIIPMGEISNLLHNSLPTFTNIIFDLLSKNDIKISFDARFMNDNSTIIIYIYNDKISSSKTNNTTLFDIIENLNKIKKFTVKYDGSSHTIKTKTGYNINIFVQERFFEHQLPIEQVQYLKGSKLYTLNNINLNILQDLSLKIVTCNINNFKLSLPSHIKQTIKLCLFSKQNPNYQIINKPKTPFLKPYEPTNTKDNSTTSNEIDLCTICLDEFNSDEDYFTFGCCSLKMHMVCAYQFFDKNKQKSIINCPSCKRTYIDYRDCVEDESIDENESIDECTDENESIDECTDDYDDDNDDVDVDVDVDYDEDRNIMADIDEIERMFKIDEEKI